MKPHVICHMMVSLDGRIHPSRWTARVVHLRYAVAAGS